MDGLDDGCLTSQTGLDAFGRQRNPVIVKPTLAVSNRQLNHPVLLLYIKEGLQRFPQRSSRSLSVPEMTSTRHGHYPQLRLGTLRRFE